MEEKLLFSILASGLLALLFAMIRTRWVSRQEVYSKKLLDISQHIAQGSMAFLRREYIFLLPFVALVASALFFVNEGYMKYQALAFLLGALASSLAGFLGMRVATKANARTTQAAKDHGLNAALRVAFTGGSVMGMTVVGLALVGLFAVFIFAWSHFTRIDEQVLAQSILPMCTAFSLGASSVALFSRVGGGIYTKAADVAADLVGKVEAGIPEDDPRNPAVIADNVGDNVGDVAGMGADLFESYVGSIVGCMILAVTVPGADLEMKIKLLFLPLLISGLGVLASIIGTFFVRIREGSDPQRALNQGSFVATGVAFVLVLVLFNLFLGQDRFGQAGQYGIWHLVGVTAIGQLAGVIIGQITEYYTGTDRRPVDSLVKASHTGTATNIITGISVGMTSTFPIIMVIGLAVLGSFLAGGLYGIGLASTGMLITLGIQLAVDAYGPIADNAGGLAEMAHFPSKVREITNKLDAVGITSAAIG